MQLENQLLGKRYHLYLQQPGHYHLTPFLLPTADDVEKDHTPIKLVQPKMLYVFAATEEAI